MDNKAVVNTELTLTKDMPVSSLLTEEITLILGNSNANFSGVTSSMLQVLAHQKQAGNVRVMGKHHLDDQSLYMSFLAVAKLCRKPLLNGQYRIFHARRVDEMLQALILKYVFRAKIKIVFSSAAQRNRSWLTKWCTAKMDAVIAMCKASSTFLSDQPDAIIYHGIDTNLYQSANNKSQAWQALPFSQPELNNNPFASNEQIAQLTKSKYGIAILGRVRQQKGTHHFVDACIKVLKKHPDFNAVVVGAVSKSHYDFAQQLVVKVEAAGLANRIVFVGEQEFDNIPKIFSTLSVVAALSDHEGFGLTVLEAMSSGAAVLATEAGAWQEVIREGVDGHVVPVDDVDAITTKLDSLLSDPEKIAEMGRNGRERVVKHYSVEREAQQLTEFYQTLS